MLETKWFQIYGLSYAETMQLSYAEWVMMQNKLNDRGLRALQKIEDLPENWCGKKK